MNGHFAPRRPSERRVPSGAERVRLGREQTEDTISGRNRQHGPGAQTRPITRSRVQWPHQSPIFPSPACPTPGPSKPKQAATNPSRQPSSRRASSSRLPTSDPCTSTYVSCLQLFVPFRNPSSAAANAIVSNFSFSALAATCGSGGLGLQPRVSVR